MLVFNGAGNGGHGLQQACRAGTMAGLHSAGGEAGYAVRKAREERFGGAELGSSWRGIFCEGAVGQGGECEAILRHCLLYLCLEMCIFGNVLEDVDQLLQSC